MYAYVGLCSICISEHTPDAERCRSPYRSAALQAMSQPALITDLPGVASVIPSQQSVCL